MRHLLVKEDWMTKGQDNSIWTELWESIKFCKESKNGKYSIDTYLDIVGEYTDRQIKLAEDKGLIYLGGECQITNSYEKATYNFEITMFFEDCRGAKILKEAKRKLPKDRFVSETNSKIGEKIKFDIQRPK
jgi:hypothetical protein